MLSVSCNCAILLFPVCVGKYIRNNLGMPGCDNLDLYVDCACSIFFIIDVLFNLSLEIIHSKNAFNRDIPSVLFVNSNLLSYLYMFSYSFLFVLEICLSTILSKANNELQEYP